MLPAPALPQSIKSLRHIPWATFGRRESAVEFQKKWEEQAARAELFADAPTFSVVVAVPAELEPKDVQELLAGLSGQSYPRWEAVFAVSPSAPLAAKMLAQHAETEPRIRVVRAESADGSGQKKEGAAQAKGEWIGFLDPSDILSPVAFFQFALELQRSPLTDLLYTNEAELEVGAPRLGAFFTKPEFSPLTLMHFNYVGRFWIVRRALYRQIKGLDETRGVAAEYDFLLRASEKTDRFLLCPLFLCYRRPERNRPAGDWDAVKKTLQGHLRRTGFKASVGIVAQGGFECVRIGPRLAEAGVAKATALIPFRNRADWTLRAAKALVSQDTELGLEIVLIDNESEASERKKIEAMLSTFSVPIKIVDYRGPFNFGRMHNQAVAQHGSGDLLLFLNNDVFLDRASELDTWAAWALQSTIGTVGIQLRYGHGAVQHAGIRAFFGGEARLVRVGNAQNEDRLTFESREVFANTFAACMVRREVFDAVGGLPELDLANGFGDVAFNLECVRHGLRNLYLGHIRGQHLESASRGPAYEYWEECELERRYPELLQKMLRYDLAYNRIPGLDYSIPVFLRQALKVKFRENTPSWLEPIKPPLKKLLRTLLEPKDNSVA